MIKKENLEEICNKEERLTNIGRLSSFLFVSNVLKFVSSLKLNNQLFERNEIFHT